jgi:hypothetical protein
MKDLQIHVQGVNDVIINFSRSGFKHQRYYIFEQISIVNVKLCKIVVYIYLDPVEDCHKLPKTLGDYDDILINKQANWSVNAK